MKKVPVFCRYKAKVLSHVHTMCLHVFSNLIRHVHSFTLVPWEPIISNIPLMLYSAHSFKSHVTSGEISQCIPGCRDVSRYFPKVTWLPGRKKLHNQYDIQNTNVLMPHWFRLNGPHHTVCITMHTTAATQMHASKQDNSSSQATVFCTEAEQ